MELDFSAVPAERAPISRHEFSSHLLDAGLEPLPNLRHYESLHVSQLGHSVVKRGAKESPHPFNTIKEVTFSALGKDFRLILHPNRQILHHNFRATVIDGDGLEKAAFAGGPPLSYPST